MPLATYSAEIQLAHIAKLKPSLMFVLAKGEVEARFQAVLGANNITSLSRFAMMGETQAEVMTFLKDELHLEVSQGMDERMLIADVCAAWASAKVRQTKEAELEADAQLAEQTRVVPQSDHKRLRKAYEKVFGELPLWETPGRFFLGTKIDEAGADEPQVERMTEVASKRDGESDTWHPVWTEDGRMTTKRGALIKVKAPMDSEELRNRHRIIGNAWLMVHLQHANRAWLEGLTERDWSKLTDYVVGEKVAKYSTKQENGFRTPQPSWAIVFNYEHELRRKVHELVTEGNTMKAAI